MNISYNINKKMIMIKIYQANLFFLNDFFTNAIVI